MPTTPPLHPSGAIRNFMASNTNSLNAKVGSETIRSRGSKSSLALRGAIPVSNFHGRNLSMCLLAISYHQQTSRVVGAHPKMSLFHEDKPSKHSNYSRGNIIQGCVGIGRVLLAAPVTGTSREAHRYVSRQCVPATLTINQQNRYTQPRRVRCPFTTRSTWCVA